MLLLPGQNARLTLLRRPERSAEFPRMSARQQGRPACCRRSAPSPDLLRHRPCRYIVASPRVAPQTRFPKACPNTFPLRRPKAATKASPELNDAPRRESAAKRPRTNACPPFDAFPSPSSPDAGRKKGGIIPPSCHRFQRIEINDCPDRIIRLCRAAHAQSRADQTDADPPFFRRGPQR